MMKPSPAYLDVTIFSILEYVGDTIRRIKHVFVSAQNAVILSVSLPPITSAQQNEIFFIPFHVYT